MFALFSNGYYKSGRVLFVQFETFIQKICRRLSYFLLAKNLIFENVYFYIQQSSPII